MYANDNKILQLKAEIEKKKSYLKAMPRFEPKTNCNLDFEGKSLNIRTLQKQATLDLMVRLNMYNLSLKDLGLECTYKLSGYKVIDWIADLNGRLDILNKVAEETKLAELEKKLTNLLSEDKKVELELLEIEKLIQA